VSGRKKLESTQDPSLAPDELLRLTAVNAPVVLFMIDNQGLIQLSFGMRMAELSLEPTSIGQSVYDLFRDLPGVIQYFERARAGEAFNVRIATDGLGSALDTRFEPLRTPDGSIQGVLGMAVEWTPHVVVEQALRRQVEMTRLLHEITQTANSAQNVEGVISFSLERICRVLGWPIGHAYLGAEDETGLLIPSPLWYCADYPQFLDFIRTTEQTEPASGKGLPGIVMETKKPYFMSNPVQHPRFARASAAAKAGIQTALAFPVLAGEEVVAMLEFFSTEIVEPDNQILELMHQIGTQLGRVVERERAHRALRESEERFRLLVESVEEYAIVILDPDGRVSSWNSGAEAIKGYSEQEILGQHLSLFYPEEACQQGIPEQALNSARQTGRYEYEGWLVRKGGACFWANVSMTPMYAESGQLIGFARVTRDMSRRKQIEEALRASESRFRTIFEGSALGIELLDLGGRLLAYNPSILRIFGYTAAELDQAVLSESAHAVNVVANSALFDQMVSGQHDSYTLERPYRHKDNNLIWGRTTVSLVRDLDKKPQFAIAMVEDITERKQMEAEVAELQRRLMEGREAERLHLAQELHDGPVQDLYGLTYHLQSLGERPVEERAASLQEAQGVVHKVIDTLRSMSGDLRPPTLAPFGLEKAIHSHARAFQESHPEIKLILELMPDRQGLPENIRLALFRIYQASLTNVLRHARAQQVDVYFSYDEQQVILEIRDDGEGFVVPARWINLARQGHLGLVSAHERAQAVGGQFIVESAPGHGTLVRVVVPRQNGLPNSP